MAMSPLFKHQRKQPSFSLQAVSYTTLFFVCLLCVASLSACMGAVGVTPQQISGHIRISGSTALFPLVHEAAANFTKLHPQAHIDVVANGSVKGLQEVTSGASSIGDSDIYADFAKYPDPNITDHIVCVIPFVMIVNPSVPMKSLTTDQIIRIFAVGDNQYQNWKELGGPDLKIQAIVRPFTSGTRDTFRKYILGGRDENGQLQSTDSSQAVLDKVASTPGAIGYLAASVLDTRVQALAINAVDATPENIIAGRYAFWSYEHMYTLGDDNPLVYMFVNDFMLSSNVQAIAKKDHYIPIADMKIQQIGSSTGGNFNTALIGNIQEVKRRES